LHDGALASSVAEASCSVDVASPFTDPASYEVATTTGCGFAGAVGSKDSDAPSKGRRMSTSLDTLPPHAPAAAATATPMAIIRTNRIRLTRIPPDRNHLDNDTFTNQGVVHVTAMVTELTTAMQNSCLRHRDTGISSTAAHDR
jgi:hypothetical protein